MMTLTEEERRLFAVAVKRHELIRHAQAQTETDAKILDARLRGARVKKGGIAYEITEIRNGWDGTISARGWRILANGKRGSQTWDIGFICPTYFDAAQA